MISFSVTKGLSNGKDSYGEVFTDILCYRIYLVFIDSEFLERHFFTFTENLSRKIYMC